MISPAGIPNCCLYDLLAFPIVTFHIVPHMPCGHQYAPWAYPHDHQYAPWAFLNLPCERSHSHMPCGHSQQAPMSRGPPQRFLFQWRFTLPWHALWAFPMAAYMPSGHSQSWYFILCSIWHVVISTPCWLTPWPPICPVGISHFALWAFPFPYALWAFPTRANALRAPSTLSFSAKASPAMICPVGIRSCCLYALWAFPILTFHFMPHMSCGHQ